MKKIRSRHQRYLEDYSKEDFASIWNFLCSRCTQLSPQSEPSWLLRLESQQCVIEHGTFCYKTSRTSSPCSMTQSPPQLHVLPGSSWLPKLCMILLWVSTNNLDVCFVCCLVLVPVSYSPVFGNTWWQWYVLLTLHVMRWLLCGWMISHKDCVQFGVPVELVFISHLCQPYGSGWVVMP